MKHTFPIMHPLDIRLAETSDADVLVQFNTAMAWETESKELNRQAVANGVRSLLDRPSDGFYLVATVKQDVVGCVMVTFEWSDWRNGFFWWIQSVYVKPEFRRRGVFRRMYESVRERAERRTGVCGLRLYVEQENLVAQRTYQSLGMYETPYRVYESAFDDSV